jgi:hypothetical protein
MEEMGEQEVKEVTVEQADKGEKAVPEEAVGSETGVASILQVVPSSS